MKIIGCDPGLSGAIAVLDLRHLNRPPVVKRMPLVDGRVNARVVCEFFNRHDLNTPVAIENVHAMPGDGRQSAFTFGAAYGALRAAAEIAQLQVLDVEPGAWKAALRLPGGKAGKDASVKVATHLWPDEVGYLANHNVAEAALIALYGAHLAAKLGLDVTMPCDVAAALAA